MRAIDRLVAAVLAPLAWRPGRPTRTSLAPLDLAERDRIAEELEQRQRRVADVVRRRVGAEVAVVHTRRAAH